VAVDLASGDLARVFYVEVLAVGVFVYRDVLP
jgi:hypothetical protein